MVEYKWCWRRLKKVKVEEMWRSMTAQSVFIYVDQLMSEWLPDWPRCWWRFAVQCNGFGVMSGWWCTSENWLRLTCRLKRLMRSLLIERWVDKCRLLSDVGRNYGARTRGDCHWGMLIVAAKLPIYSMSEFWLVMTIEVILNCAYEVWGFKLSHRYCWY